MTRMVDRVDLHVYGKGLHSVLHGRPVHDALFPENNCLMALE